MQLVNSAPGEKFLFFIHTAEGAVFSRLTAEMEASEAFNLSSLLQGWADVLDAEDLVKTTDIQDRRRIGQRMDIPHDMVKELAFVCGTDTLDCPGEMETIEDKLKKVPPQTGLVTLGFQSKVQETKQNQLKQKRKYRFQLPSVIHAIEARKPAPKNAVAIPDVLIRVLVHRPFGSYPNSQYGFSNVALTVEHEFDVLGSQLLTDLKDRILCVSDYSIPGEYSSNPDSQFDIMAKDVFHGSFIFIEGTFYNDTRHPQAPDYSSVIREWAKKPTRGIGPFTSKCMQDVRFRDLTLKLGQPYVYVHQGDCEHLVIFADVRLLHPDDCNDITQYPLLVNRSRPHKVVCKACLESMATWVTIEDPLAPEDPCFFCDRCLKALHYNKKGEKLVEFKAYPYVNRVMLLDMMKVSKDNTKRVQQPVTSYLQVVQEAPPAVSSAESKKRKTESRETSQNGQVVQNGEQSGSCTQVEQDQQATSSTLQATSSTQIMQNEQASSPTQIVQHEQASSPTQIVQHEQAASSTHIVQNELGASSTQTVQNKPAASSTQTVQDKTPPVVSEGVASVNGVQPIATHTQPGPASSSTVTAGGEPRDIAMEGVEAPVQNTTHPENESKQSGESMQTDEKQRVHVVFPSRQTVQVVAHSQSGEG